MTNKIETAGSKDKLNPAQLKSLKRFLEHVLIDPDTVRLFEKFKKMPCERAGFLFNLHENFFPYFSDCVPEDLKNSRKIKDSKNFRTVPSEDINERIRDMLFETNKRYLDPKKFGGQVSSENLTSFLNDVNETIQKCLPYERVELEKIIESYQKIYNVPLENTKTVLFKLNKNALYKEEIKKYSKLLSQDGNLRHGAVLDDYAELSELVQFNELKRKFPNSILICGSTNYELEEAFKITVYCQDIPHVDVENGDPFLGLAVYLDYLHEINPDHEIFSKFSTLYDKIYGRLDLPQGRFTFREK